ncbi:hypothetical protein BFS14_14575 [Serratia fonticola]|uniref:hypothetical protein n=1 Tax=Serratia fonticola TaxID=47917 RepID=UPI0008FD2DFE|nr:hypothetical protein [Serratia fonticola]OIX95587.1 hypothetical protein BFS14_14575 [Serratia fonticola]QCR62099.1 hypothetical protein FD644_17835 [Serratia fonticola]
MADTVEHMEQTEFQITYGGDAYQNNQIDAKVLGEALSSLALLIEDSEKILHGDNKDAKVNVKAQKEGSFEVLVTVAGVSISTLQALGLAAGSGIGIGSIWAVLALLKGKKIAHVTIDEQTQTAKLEVPGEEEPIECSNNVQKLVTNQVIRKQVEKLVYEPLKTEKPSTFKVQQDEAPLIVVKQEDKGIFKATGSPVKKETISKSYEANVHFSRVNFLSNSGWYMVLPNGEEVSVAMNDNLFITQVSQSETKLAADDLFSVSIVKKVTRTNGVIGSTAYSITKVIRHRTTDDKKII